jgi:hypothetical protein
LSVQLIGLSQGGRSSFGNTVTTNVNFVQVNTRQIIQALAAATANSFSSTSKLVVVTPLNGGNTSIQVRDGNKTPVDVSDFIVLESDRGSVTSSILNTRTGRGSSVTYQIMHLVLQDADGDTLNLHIDVNGVATSNSTTFSNGPTVDANVAGSGDRNGNGIIFQGSVSIFGQTLEVVDDGGGFGGVS